MILRATVELSNDDTPLYVPPRPFRVPSGRDLTEFFESRRDRRGRCVTHAARGEMLTIVVHKSAAQARGERAQPADTRTQLVSAIPLRVGRAEGKGVEWTTEKKITWGG